MPRAKNDLKFVTLNVRGLHDTEKRANIFKWLRDKKADIIFLQETFCTQNIMSSFNLSWLGTIEHALTDSPHSRGVGILINEKHTVVIENKHASYDGRMLLLNVEVNGKQMTLLNVYASNTEKGRKDIFNLYVAGDINCCLRIQDRSNNTHLRVKSRQVLDRVITNNRLVDAWAQTTDNPGFTYEDRQCNTRSRLDYIFVSEQAYTLGSGSVSVSICPCVPDHNAVVLKVSVSCNERVQTTGK